MRERDREMKKIREKVKNKYEFIHLNKDSSERDQLVSLINLNVHKMEDSLEHRIFEKRFGINDRPDMHETARSNVYLRNLWLKMTVATQDLQTKKGIHVVLRNRSSKFQSYICFQYMYSCRYFEGFNYIDRN